MADKIELRIYRGASDGRGGFNGSFLHFNEDIQKVIGGNGKVSGTVDQKQNVLTIFPDDNGHTVSKNHAHSWKIYVGGKVGKYLQKYEKRAWSNVSIEDLPVGINVKLRKLVINLNDYDKESEKEKQEEVMPTNMNVRETLTFADAVSKVLHQQDEILERIKRLEEAFK